MPRVFIVSNDWTLRAAVRAELRDAHFDARGMDAIADVGEAIAQGIAPAAVVLDAAMEIGPAQRQAIANLAQRVPLVVVASRIEPGAGAQEWLGKTAAVLFRPVRVGDIVACVKKILRGEAA